MKLLKVIFGIFGSVFTAVLFLGASPPAKTERSTPADTLDAKFTPAVAATTDQEQEKSYQATEPSSRQANQQIGAERKSRFIGTNKLTNLSPLTPETNHALKQVQGHELDEFRT